VEAMMLNMRNKTKSYKQGNKAEWVRIISNKTNDGEEDIWRIDE